MLSTIPIRSTGPLATPSIVLFPAIDPASASNVSNYSLTLTNPNGTQTNESQFISECDVCRRHPANVRRLHHRVHRHHQPYVPDRPAGG